MPTLGVVCEPSLGPLALSEGKEIASRSTYVVADDCSVDDKLEERVLVCGSVVLEQCRSVVVTDGGVCRPLSSRETCNAEKGEDGRGTHGDGGAESRGFQGRFAG